MMTNLSADLPIFCLALIIYLYAFYLKNKKLKYSIALLLLGGIILRVFVGFDVQIHAWDERFHALVAKNILANPLKPTLYLDPILSYDFRDWTSNHVWLHKQPFSLYTIALSLKFFGNSALAVRLPSIILSSISILIMFEIGKLMFNKEIGFFSAFLFSIHGLIIEASGGRVSTDHVDLMFLCLTLFSIYFLIKYQKTKKNVFHILAAIIFGLAVLTKWLPAFFILPIWILLFKSEFKLGRLIRKFIEFISLSIIIFLPWQLYIFSEFPIESSWESQYNFLHITKPVEGHEGNIFYHLNAMRLQYGEPIYLSLIFLGFLFYKSTKNIYLQILILWISIPYLVFSLVGTKMPLYTLIAAPGLFIVTALFIDYIIKAMRNHKGWKRTSLILVLIFTIGLPIRYSIERTKLFQDYNRKPDWALELIELDEQYGSDNETVIFNISRPIETMFYTNLTAYDFIPSPSKIDSLIEENYLVLINKNNDQNLANKQIKFVDLNFN